jgi:hypothetical protein
VLAGGDDTLSLGVVVPGGQQVYVAPDGSLSYTLPHSVSKPDGSIQTGFSKTAPSNGNSFGYLNYGAGFIACPGEQDEGWQVFGAATADTHFGDECLGFSALTCKFFVPAWLMSCGRVANVCSASVDGPGAWEY